MHTIQEIVLLDKPKGITSRKALVRLAEHFGERKLKMGYAGTLDPNASGLMIVGVGTGTKKLKEYVGLPKTYIAEILLGVRTTTGDVDGDTIETTVVPEFSETQLKEALEGMVGVLRLPVSAFSAVKRGGEPLYKKAHRGEDVGTLPLRDMEIHSAQYAGHKHLEEGIVVKAEFVVASGVYIRSLAEEFGRRLRCPATLKNLRRTAIGDFRVDEKEVITVSLCTKQ